MQTQHLNQKVLGGLAENWNVDRNTFNSQQWAAASQLLTSDKNIGSACLMSAAKAEQDRRDKLIPYDVDFVLTEKQQQDMKEWFPEFDFTFNQCRRHSHPVPALADALTRKLIAKKIDCKSRVTDVGAKPRKSITMGLPNMHWIMSGGTAEDTARYIFEKQQLARLQEEINNSTDKMSKHKIKVYSAFNSLKEPNGICVGTLAQCNHQTDVFLLNHVALSIEPNELFKAMIRCRTTIAYATFTYAPEILLLTRVRNDATGVKIVRGDDPKIGSIINNHDNPIHRAKRDDSVVYYVINADGRVYQHDFEKVYAWYYLANAVHLDGYTFAVDRSDVRAGNITYTITCTPGIHPGVDAQIVSFPNISKEVIVVRVPFKIDKTDIRSYNVYIYPSDLWKRVSSYAYANFSDTDDIMAILSKVTNFTRTLTTSIINKGTLIRHQIPQGVDLSRFAALVVLYQLQEKHKDNHIVAAGMAAAARYNAFLNSPFMDLVVQYVVGKVVYIPDYCVGRFRRYVLQRCRDSVQLEPMHVFEDVIKFQHYMEKEIAIARSSLHTKILIESMRPLQGFRVDPRHYLGLMEGGQGEPPKAIRDIRSRLVASDTFVTVEQIERGLIPHIDESDRHETLLQLQPIINSIVGSQTFAKTDLLFFNDTLKNTVMVFVPRVAGGLVGRSEKIKHHFRAIVSYVTTAVIRFIGILADFRAYESNSLHIPRRTTGPITVVRRGKCHEFSLKGYEYCYADGEFYKVLRGEPQGLPVNKMEVYVSDALMYFHAHEHLSIFISLKTLNLRDIEITRVKGVPGACKTTTLVQGAQTTDIITTNTKAAQVDVIGKGRERGKDLVARTLDSAMLNLRPGAFTRMLADEADMCHYGQIVYVAQSLQVESLVMFGDPNQIPFVSFIGDFEAPDAAIPDSPSDLRLNISARIPPDVCALIAPNYNNDIFTTKEKPGLEARLVTDPVSFLDGLPGAQVVTFTQNEKKDLISKLGSKNKDRVATCHEVQGQTHAIVVVVRAESKTLEIYENNDGKVNNWALVGLTRAAERAIYVTVVQDGLYSLIVDIVGPTATFSFYVFQRTDKELQACIDRIVAVLVTAKSSGKPTAMHNWSIAKVNDFETIYTALDDSAVSKFGVKLDTTTEFIRTTGKHIFHVWNLRTCTGVKNVWRKIREGLYRAVRLIRLAGATRMVLVVDGLVDYLATSGMNVEEGLALIAKGVEHANARCRTAGLTFVITQDRHSTKILEDVLEEDVSDLETQSICSSVYTGKVNLVEEHQIMEDYQASNDATLPTQAAVSSMVQTLIEALVDSQDLSVCMRNIPMEMEIALFNALNVFVELYHTGVINVCCSHLGPTHLADPYLERYRLVEQLYSRSTHMYRQTGFYPCFDPIDNNAQLKLMLGVSLEVDPDINAVVNYFDQFGLTNVLVLSTIELARDDVMETRKINSTIYASILTRHTKIKTTTTTADVAATVTFNPYCSIAPAGDCWKQTALNALQKLYIEGYFDVSFWGMTLEQGIERLESLPIFTATGLDIRSHSEDPMDILQGLVTSTPDLSWEMVQGEHRSPNDLIRMFYSGDPAGRNGHWVAEIDGTIWGHNGKTLHTIRIYRKSKPMQLRGGGLVTECWLKAVSLLVRDILNCSLDDDSLRGEFNADADALSVLRTVCALNNWRLVCRRVNVRDIRAPRGILAYYPNGVTGHWESYVKRGRVYVASDDRAIDFICSKLSSASEIYTVDPLGKATQIKRRFIKCIRDVKNSFNYHVCHKQPKFKPVPQKYNANLLELEDECVRIATFMAVDLNLFYTYMYDTYCLCDESFWTNEFHADIIFYARAAKVLRLFGKHVTPESLATAATVGEPPRPKLTIPETPLNKHVLILRHAYVSPFIRHSVFNLHHVFSCKYQLADVIILPSTIDPISPVIFEKILRYTAHVGTKFYVSCRTLDDMRISEYFAQIDVVDNNTTMRVLTGPRSSLLSNARRFNPPDHVMLSTTATLGAFTGVYDKILAEPAKINQIMETYIDVEIDDRDVNVGKRAEVVDKMMESNLISSNLPVVKCSYVYPTTLDELDTYDEPPHGDLATLQDAFDNACPINAFIPDWATMQEHHIEMVETIGDKEYEFDDFNIAFNSGLYTSCLVQQYYRPNLHTAYSPRRPNTQNEILLAIQKRNLHPNYLRLPGDDDAFAATVIDNFLRKCCVPEAVTMLRRFAEETIAPSYANVTSWLASQDGPKIARLLANGIRPLEEQPINIFSIAIKRDIKSRLELNKLLTEYPRLQVIAAHDPDITATFSPVIRQLMERLKMILRPDVLINIGYEDIALSRFVSQYHRINLQEHLEIDFSAFDKTQHRLAHTIKMRFLKMLGMDPYMYEIWEQNHRMSLNKARDAGFSYYTEYQQKSGDAMTTAGNCILCALVVAYQFREVPFDYMLVLGDDNLVGVRGFKARKEDSEWFGYSFNLEAKLINQDHGYFCGRFLVESEDSVTLMPDPIKRLDKLGNLAVRSEAHILDQFNSFGDVTKTYASEAMNAKLSQLVAKRYKVDYDFTAAIGTMYRFGRDYKLFRTLYGEGPSKLVKHRDYIAFFGKESFLSNHYPSPMFIDERYYPTVEHYYLSQKAYYLGRDDIAILIEKCHSGAEAKRIARRLPSADNWYKGPAEATMHRALNAKFMDDKLRMELITTGDKLLYECNPHDEFWSTGLTSDAKQLKKGRFPGRNLLGLMLMNIRADIKKDNSPFN